MSHFLGYVCQSCLTVQSEKFTLPTKSHYLSGSICTQCGQVIPTETKRKQIDEYLLSRLNNLDLTITQSLTKRTSVI